MVVLLLLYSINKVLVFGFCLEFVLIRFEFWISDWFLIL